MSLPPLEVMSGSYNALLVVLSIVLGATASYVALDLAGRLTVTAGWARLGWLVGGSLAMGVGIWSMHFTGMLAFRLHRGPADVPMTYDMPLMALSVAVAVAASALALVVVARAGRAGVARLGAAGLLMGGAICGMHYIGMASMRVPAAIAYRPALVGGSVVIAVGAAFAALWLAYRLRDESRGVPVLRRLGAAMVMGAAIAGMHYTAMTAAIFTPRASDAIPVASGAVLATHGLAGMVGAGTLVVLILALLGAALDRWIRARLARASEHERLFRAAELARVEAERAQEQLQGQAVELELQMEEAQALAEELEATNEQLQQTAAVTEAARARAEALQRVTATLARARTTADVGRVFSRQLTTLLGADTAWVGRVASDGSAVEALGWAGYGDGAATHWRRIPLDSAISLTDAIRSGRPHWWATPDALIAAYPARAAVIEAAGQESVAILPLLHDGERPTDAGVGPAVGGIVVGFRARQTFDDDTQGFFVALAQQCAQALERARLFEAERAARQRAETLQEVTAALAAARTMPDVARAALTAALEKSGASSGTVALASADGAWLEKVADVGLTGRPLTEWQRFPSRGPYPAAEVVATRRPQFLADRASYVARYPDTEPALRALGIEASAVLPLAPATDGPAAGYLAFHFSAPHAFPPEDVAFFGALAQVTAQALERARLYEAEQAARAEAQAANRVKSEFLATMSHELRTPLNAIAGYAELLQLGIHGPITDAQSDALRRIQRSQTHLLAVINEVLNYARLEAGVVQYNTGVVDVAGALTNIESLVSPQVRAKGLRLAVTGCDEGLTVRADMEKLDQVLLNLLSNAVKFTEAGGEITITCQVHTTTDDGGEAERYVTIAVADTGIGIPADQLEHIFEPFVQVGRALNSPVEGTGLGLAISRDLARGMGGELTVVSEVGLGSIFAVTLPGA